MSFPDRPSKFIPPDQPGVNEVRRKGDRDQQYADFVRKQWLTHQKQANQEAARITRRARRSA